MSDKLDRILAEISAGELIDKITILEIKKAKIAEKEKLVEVEKELSSLTNTMNKFISDESKKSKYKNVLMKINSKLWDLENSKRASEKSQDLVEKFIDNARNVYKLNDERARTKLSINNLLGSNIKEVKSHF